jgi:hypothetical protein
MVLTHLESGRLYILYRDAFRSDQLHAFANSRVHFIHLTLQHISYSHRVTYADFIMGDTDEFPCDKDMISVVLLYVIVFHPVYRASCAP